MNALLPALNSPTTTRRKSSSSCRTESASVAASGLDGGHGRELDLQVGEQPARGRQLLIGLARSGPGPATPTSVRSHHDCRPL